MKRVLAILLAMMLSLSACGGGNGSTAPNDNPSNTVQPTDSDVLDSSSSDDGGGTLSLFKTEYIPVASSKDCFIVRNESGNLYGLLNSSGATILPCEYEEISFSKAKSQTVLKVMHKGSYGVFDLNGNELIPCDYTEIRFSPYDDSCIVQTFENKLGVLDLNGNTILPIDFDMVEFGYGKIIVAGNKESAQESAWVAAYSPDGKLIKDFPWDKDAPPSISATSGGTVLTVGYMSGISGNVFNRDCFPIDNESEAVWGDTKAVGNHIFYFQGHNLIVRDIDTQNDLKIWSFPSNQDWNAFEIRSVSNFMDPVSNTEFVDLCVFGGNFEKNYGEKCYLRVSFNDTPTVIDYNAVGIYIDAFGGDNLGAFYDGIAIVFPTDGYLYTINTAGEKVDEIKKPYTSRDDSFLLGNAAVLNNNGFYSIVDSNGELLLSEDGYANIQKVNVAGIYAVTDQNGKLGLINEYAEELVPCGGIDTLEMAIKRPSTGGRSLETSHAAEDELYSIYCNDKWAIYSSSKYQLLTDFMELTGEDSWQHNCFLGNNGYALINEEANTLYLISCNGSSYEVYSYLNLI